MQENSEFMNYTPRFYVFEQDIKMSTLFDFFDLLKEETNKYVPFYPELSYLTSMLNESEVDELTCLLLEKPFMDHFSAVTSGQLPFDSLVGINIFSKVFLKAAHNFFQDQLDSFLKQICSCLVNSKEYGMLRLLIHSKKIFGN